MLNNELFKQTSTVNQNIPYLSALTSEVPLIPDPHSTLCPNNSPLGLPVLPAAAPMVLEGHPAQQELLKVPAVDEAQPAQGKPLWMPDTVVTAAEAHLAHPELWEMPAVVAEVCSAQQEPQLMPTVMVAEAKAGSDKYADLGGGYDGAAGATLLQGQL